MAALRSNAFLASIAVVLAALTGCGGSSGGSGSSSRTPTVVSTAPASNPRLHGADVLVDSRGFVLYAFSKDSENSFRSACRGACEASWPPLILAGNAPVASGRALSTQLGAVKRPDGSLQVAYAGHLLYTYPRERRPGEALGEGAVSFGGSWHALSPAGRPISR
jgi:predicted lipoprotein with Yx(FWY)xxD motif